MEFEPKLYLWSPSGIIVAKEKYFTDYETWDRAYFLNDHTRLIVKETYGCASESPARPAIPPPASSSVFQYALQAISNGQNEQLLHTWITEIIHKSIKLLDILHQITIKKQVVKTAELNFWEDKFKKTAFTVLSSGFEVRSYHELYFSNPIVFLVHPTRARGKGKDCLVLGVFLFHFGKKRWSNN